MTTCHPAPYEHERDVALHAVARASALCRKVQAGLITEETLAKQDRSPVTVADYGAQAVILHVIKQAFPNDPVVAEEDSQALRDPANATLCATVTQHVQEILPDVAGEEILADIDRGQHGGGASGRFWTLDPIDGTKGFIRKEQYAVALALIEDGNVVLAVLGCPNLPAGRLEDDDTVGVVVHATVGGGTFLQTLGGGVARRVSVSATSDGPGAAFCESVESGHSAHDQSARIAETLGITRASARLDSQCKYAVVARGEADIYLRLPTRADYEEKIWDHAAGALVVEEAGGTVTDITGAPLDFTQGRTLSRNKGIIATNGTLHPVVLAAITANK